MLAYHCRVLDLMFGPTLLVSFGMPCRICFFDVYAQAPAIQLSVVYTIVSVGLYNKYTLSSVDPDINPQAIALFLKLFL